jgi:hypothetical protein
MMNLQRLLVSVNDINQPPTLYDVLMQRYRSCKMVARVLCLVAREWLIMKHQRLLVSMNDITQPLSLYDVLMQRYRSCKMVAMVLCLVAREWLNSCQS